jgi:PAS domain S-box-containing protein
MKLLTKLFLFFIPLTLLLIGSAVIISRSGTHKVLTGELNSRGLAQISGNIPAFSRAFESRTETALLPLLQALKEQTQGDRAAALDQTGRVMAHTNVMEKNKIYSDALATRMLRSDAPVFQETAVKGDTILELSAPVWREEEEKEDFLLSAGDKPQKQRLGTIVLGVSLRRMAQLENRLFLRQTAFFAAGVGGLSLGLILFVIFVVLRPARRLAEGISKVGEGQYGLTVPVRSNDELGQLTAAFNHMAENLGATTVSRDKLAVEIVERRRVEEALRETEEKYRIQFEGALDAIFVADAETGLLTDLNPAAENLVGKKRSELIGLHQRTLHPIQEPGKELLDDTFKCHLAEKKGCVLETQVITGSGEIKDVAIMANLLEIGGKKFLQGIFRDITEQVKIKKVLKESETRLRLLWEGMPIPLVVIDEELHTILYANSASLRLIGAPLENITGRVCHNFICPAEKGKCPISDLGQAVDNSERVLIKADGSRAPILKTVVSFFLDGRKCLIESFVDLSDRKRLELTLLQSEKMSAVGQLAAGVAHEINNPLGIILGFAQSVVKRLKSEDDPLALPLRTIEREAVRCKNLVQNLLVFSRTSKNEKLEEIDLNAVLEGALSLVSAQTKTRNVELVRELGAGLPKIHANQIQLQQVLINLSNNAVDAMPKGGSLTVRTALSVRQPGYVEIQVRDTGDGIPKEVQKKIFEPFFTTKEVGKGTGLGLSLVYEIVQKHGGTIKLESEEGKGTEFTVLLPVSAPAAKVS